MDAGAGCDVEEETIVGKRRRRVSFAETTAVHVFEREEDLETPVDHSRGENGGSRPSNGGELVVSTGCREVMTEYGEDCDAAAEEAEDEDGDGEEEEIVPPVRFWRDLECSSPGSAAGSFASNDGDNIFGPVSRSFIASGRPSDSGISDDGNPDITLDSATFSLHFRNMAPPDDRSVYSVGSLGDSSNPSGSGSQKMASRLKSGGEADTLSDFSMLTSTSRRYDYDNFSPTLEALIEGVNRTLQTTTHEDIFVNGMENGKDSSRISMQHALDEEVGNKNWSISHSELSDVATASNQTVNIALLHSLKDGTCLSDSTSVIPQEHGESVDEVAPSGFIETYAKSSEINSPQIILPVTSQHPHTSPQIGKKFPISQIKEISKDCEQMCPEPGTVTPKVSVQFPAPESVSNLRVKRQKLFLDALSNVWNGDVQTSSVYEELLNHGRRISAIKTHMARNRVLNSTVNDNSRPFSVKGDDMQMEMKNTLKQVARNPEMKSDAVSSVHIMRDASVVGVSEWNRKDVSAPEIANVESIMKDSNFTQDDFSVQLQDSTTARVGIPLSSQEAAEDIGTATEGVLPLSHISLSARKRRIGGIVDGENVNISTSTLQNLTQTSKLDLVPSISPKHVTNQKEAHPTQTLNQITSCMSEITMQLFSPAIYELNLHELDLLEQKLLKLQMARKYGTLSISLKKNLEGPYNPRIAEVISLREKLLFKKANLQLHRLKCDRLKHRAEAVHGRLLKSNDLKKKVLPYVHNFDAAETTADGHLHTIASTSNSKNQEEVNRLDSKMAELKALKGKVDNLAKSLREFCNVEQNIGCHDLMKLAKEELERRRHCQAIFQHLRAWEINKIVREDDHYEITLSYSDLIFQRVMIRSQRMSSASVNITLDKTKIIKTFLNMDAFTAFDFVFKGRLDRKDESLKFLQQDIYETSLLLGNLVDVLEEVQVAKMELLNLTKSTFLYDQANGQLELQLCFLHFSSGQKLVLSLNMTSLNRAVYPREPSELDIRIHKSQTTHPQSTADNIMAQVRQVPGGYQALLRVARCVSVLIHSAG